MLLAFPKDSGHADEGIPEENTDQIFSKGLLL